MDELIKNMTNYLDYLINDMKLCVSVHFSDETFNKLHRSVTIALSHYTVHRNTYCFLVKETNYPRCLESQRRLILSGKDHSPKVCTCYAGVREIVYPIFKDGAPVGIISVSGYRTEEAPKNIINPSLWSSALDKREIPSRLTNVIIPPLCVMLEEVVKFESEETEEVNRILLYIADNPRGASLDKISKHFGRSRSHISHIFKTKTGKTIRAYCNDMKLNRARELLSSTELSITEIALDAGFEDASYFISLFKERYGTTPYKYKRNTISFDLP